MTIPVGSGDQSSATAATATRARKASDAESAQPAAAKSEQPSPSSPSASSLLQRVSAESALQSDARRRAGAVDAQRAHSLASTFAPTTRPAVTEPAPPPANRPGVTDVGALRPGELEQLRRSPNVEDRRRAATIERAQRAYADHIARGGRVIVSTSAANGGYPVVTLLPPGFDPSKPARVHTHYHGHRATAADPRDHSSGTTRRIEELQRQDPQAVFVLPESANNSWTNVGSQAQTTRDALRDAGVDNGNVAHRTVSVHSGGGAALARAMQSSRDGSGVEADRLELQDSLYGSQHAVAAWARTPAGRAAREVVYFHGTNPGGRDAPIRAAFGDRYRYVQVRGPDAHNRAVYDHMGF